MREVLRSEIHRARVTDANPDYVGSILIDKDLMDRVDLWEFEKVLVCDITNGNRFETYALAGEQGSGVIAVQGAAARLSATGNCVAIMSFEVTGERPDPRIILVDQDNRFVEYLGGAKHGRRFSERETESYYDLEDVIYRSVWDENGSVHWGLFDESGDKDFLKACGRLNRTMFEKGRIGQDSSVLDLGCGNGTTAIWLAGESGGRVTGIDISGVRVANALEKRAVLSPECREKVAFSKASATELPFPDGSFTHVWSQAVIYHVPDKRKVLSEVHRVLADGGILVFDDLFRPKRDITAEAQAYVYDRLLFDTEFTFESYQQALKNQGFDVLEVLDLSQHLKQSYLCLSERTPKDETLDDAGHYKWLTTAYIETAAAVDKNELGWGLFICRR